MVGKVYDANMLAITYIMMENKRGNIRRRESSLRRLLVDSLTILNGYTQVLKSYIIYSV